MSFVPNDECSLSTPYSTTLSNLDFLGISRRELTLSSTTANNCVDEATSMINLSGSTAVTARPDTTDAIFRLALLFTEPIEDLMYDNHKIKIEGGHMRWGLEKLVKRYVSELQSTSSQTFRSGMFKIHQELIKVYMMGKDRIEMYFDLPQQAQDVKGMVNDFRARSGPHAELSRLPASCKVDILRAALVNSAHLVVATANTRNDQEAWAIYHRSGETCLRVVGYLLKSAIKKAEPWAAE